MKDSIVDRPPSKALRFGLRLPLLLYRLRLGWLLGNRFLILTYTGRRSGQAHQTVIEVVQHDRETDTYYVVSGWGAKADWYQNIQKNPSVNIRVSGHKFHARATFISLAEAFEIMEDYIAKHPLAFKELSSLFLGERSLPDGDAARRLAEKMPMVAFCPAPSAYR
jgi:deazaflavin-dependent oxidoreductase (nitroreductase family)